MEYVKGYYSIIQYCPDLSRLEAVNIGVALFCPEIRFLRARFGRRRTGISQLFGAQDWEFVSLQQQAIEERFAHEDEAFRTLDDFEAYILRRAGSLILTSPRPVKVENPDLDLSRLLSRLAGSQREAAVRAAGVSRELGHVFQDAGVGPRLKRDVVIHPPSLPKPFRAPFAYQNGRLNLVEPMQFEGLTPSAVFSRASVQAVEGQFLKDYRDPVLGELNLVVVGKFSPDQAQERATAENVLQRHNVSMYTFESLDPLIAEIRQFAH